MTEAKLLVYDIETAPINGYTWKTWDTNVINGGIKQPWFMLSFGWKWVGEDDVNVLALPDFPKTYKKDKTNDHDLAEALRDLFNEADVTITHNGVSFDNPKAKTRMVVNGITPPTYYREVDTYQVAKRQFKFDSNSLKDLAVFLGLPDLKGNDGGFTTWLGCMAGNADSWAIMKEYNKQDVVVTEQLFQRLLPWIPNMPNMGVLTDRPNACPRCGVEGRLQKRGWRNYSATRRQQFQCQACHGYCGGRKTEKLLNNYVSL